MMVDFLFFIGIAAICFSGLLFTLHNLGAYNSHLSFVRAVNLDHSYSCWFGEVVVQEHRVAHGTDLVREHLPELCASRKLSSHIRASAHDDLRRAVEHTTPHKWVSPAVGPSLCILIMPIVLISILSNTFARIDAVSADQCRVTSGALSRLYRTRNRSICSSIPSPRLKGEVPKGRIVRYMLILHAAE